MLCSKTLLQNDLEQLEVHELPDYWRSLAQYHEGLTDTQSGAVFRLAASQLEHLIERHQATSLTLQEAASESGYSVGHLGDLVREGTIPNAGTEGRPRILRRDLPRKPGVTGAAKVISLDLSKVVQEALEDVA